MSSSTRRHRRLLVAVAIFAVTAVTLTGCSTASSWFHSERPTTFIQPAGPCPTSTGKARDVRATGDATAHLVPGGNATRGIICIYAGPLNDSQRLRRVVLDSAGASRLARALLAVSLKAPSSQVVNCPADTGGFAIISLGFPGTKAIDIWWHKTGCQTLDNGAVGATETANASFGRFSDAVRALIH